MTQSRLGRISGKTYAKVTHVGVQERKIWCWVMYMHSLLHLKVIWMTNNEGTWSKLTHIMTMWITMWWCWGRRVTMISFYTWLRWWWWTTKEKWKGQVTSVSDLVKTSDSSLSVKPKFNITRLILSLLLLFLYFLLFTPPLPIPFWQPFTHHGSHFVENERQQDLFSVCQHIFRRRPVPNVASMHKSQGLFRKRQ